MKAIITNIFKYTILVLGIVALAWGSLRVWQKDRRNEKLLNEYSQEYLQQQQANNEQEKTNDALRQQIEGLAIGTPEVLEEQARETLNMTKEGETFFSVPEENLPEKSATQGKTNTNSAKP